MAKQVQLKQNGQDIYPQTITQAVADTTTGLLLTNYLERLKTMAGGWAIAASGDSLGFTLTGKDFSGNTISGGTFTVAQDIYLDQAIYVGSAGDVPTGHTAPGSDFPYLLMIFNTAGGKNDIWVALKDLVDTYTADGQGIEVTNNEFSLELDPAAGNILSKSATGLLATIAATGDTYVGAAIDATDKNKVVVSADVAAAFSAVTGSETASGQLADAAQVKKYIDDQVGDVQVSAESKSTDYITASASNNMVTVSAVTGTITGSASDLTGAAGIADAAATATAVKTYVDGQIDALNADESGETTDTFIKVQVVQESGEVSSVVVTDKVVAVSAATSDNKGLAEASDVKGYVDNAVSGAVADLDATVSGESGPVKVQVVQTDGELTSVAVTATTHTVADAVATTADGLAMAADVKAYVDDQIGGKDADVSGETTDKFINVRVVETDGALTSVTVTDKVQAVATADSTDATKKGLAEASDVKDYVADEIAKLDATQSGASSGVTVTVAEGDGKLTGVTVAVDAVTDSAMTGTLTGKLVEAQAIKNYVDAQAAATQINDTSDINAEPGASGGTDLSINFANGGTESSAETNNPVFNGTQALAINGKQVYMWAVTAEDKGDVTVVWPTNAQNNG